MRARALTFILAAAALAGCGGAAGGGPRLTNADAAPLIALAHRIGHEGACAQARDIRRLSSLAVSLVNERRVPAELAEPLISGVNALSEQAPLCLPPVKPTPPQGVKIRPPKTHEHGHGHGKHRGEGD